MLIIAADVVEATGVAGSLGIRRCGSGRRAVIVRKDAGSTGPSLVKIAFSNEVLMLTMGAMGTIVPRLALDSMLSTSLTSPEWAGVLATEDSSFMKMATTSQLILDLVKFIHFLAIFLWAEFAERGLVLGLTRFGFSNSTLDLLI